MSTSIADIRAERLSAALRIAESGAPVFPCRANNKRPEATGWQDQATTDPDQIRAWLGNGTERNYGVRTGTTGGVVVLDADGTEGVEVVREWELKHGEIPETVAVLTPGGGCHFYFRNPDGMALGNRTKIDGAPVDFRGAGGFVIGSGSVHPNGGIYTFEASGHPDDTAIAAMPEWLLAKVHKDKPAAGAESAAPVEPADDFPTIRADVEADPESDFAKRFRGEPGDHEDKSGSGVLHSFAHMAAKRGHSREETAAAIIQIGMTVFGYDRAKAEHKARTSIANPDIKWTPVKRTRRPETRADICLNDPPNKRPDEINDDIIEALAERDLNLYASAGALVQIVNADPPKDKIRRAESFPQIVELPRAGLAERIDKHCTFHNLKMKGEGAAKRFVRARAGQPKSAVGQIMARGQWPGFRPLRAITSFPIFSPDGSLYSQTGYDKKSGVYVALDGLTLSVPEHPTREDAQGAAELHADMLRDFPFEESGPPSKPLAAMLTPLAWHFVNHPAPMFLAEADCQGTGKSLLWDYASTVLSGRLMPKASFGEREEERDKIVTAWCRAGDGMLCMDNIKGRLESAVIEKILTGRTHTGRTLGATEMRSYDVPGPLFGTANNTSVSADMARRLCVTRLVAGCERPDERTGFRYPNLLQTALARRAELLSGLLTILKAYVAAGLPEQELPTWGSYEAWSHIVRGAAVWIGWPDPADGRSEFRDAADDETAALHDVLTGLEGMDPLRRGVSAEEIAKVANDAPSHFDEAHVTAMRAGILTLAANRNGKVDVRGIGYKLRAFRNRIVRGRRLVCIQGKTRLWTWEKS